MPPLIIPILLSSPSTSRSVCKGSGDAFAEVEGTVACAVGLLIEVEALLLGKERCRWRDLGIHPPNLLF